MSHHAPSDDTEKKADSSTHESVTSIDNKDEALKLVGLEQSVTFTEEQYRQLRWKLVRIRSLPQ